MAVAQGLIDDLGERGLTTDRALEFVIDGAEALRKPIRKRFGDLALVQRCQVHKRRNALATCRSRCMPACDGR